MFVNVVACGFYTIDQSFYMYIIGVCVSWLPGESHISHHIRDSHISHHIREKNNMFTSDTLKCFAIVFR